MQATLWPGAPSGSGGSAGGPGRGGEGRGPCAEFWTSHKPGRKELRNRTREHWVARTNAFGVRVNGQQVEYWWFPYTKDAVGLMYFRFRKLSEKERWQAEGEIPGSPAKKSGKKKSSDKFVSYHAGVDDERLEIAIDALMGVMVEHKMGDHETAQELLYFVLRAYRPDMFTDFDRTKDPVRCMKWAFENLLAVYKESVTANINEMSGDPKKDLEELEIACREKKKEFMTLFRQYKSR